MTTGSTASASAPSQCANPAEGTGAARFSCDRRACSDVDEHAAALGRWDQHYDQLSPGRFSGEVTDLWLDRLQVFREVTNQIVEQRGSAWPGARFFGVVMDSEGEGMFCGRPLGAGGAAAFASGNAFTMRTPPRLDVIGVALSRETLQAHADATGDALLLQCGSEEDGLWLSDSAELSAVRRYLADFFATAVVDPSVLGWPEVQRSVFSSLMDGLSAAIERGRGAVIATASRRARAQIVDQARDTLARRGDMLTTVAELCVEIEVCRRTLQYAFQDILGVSPVQYLRAVRLNGVRRALRRAGPDARIGDIAAEWGFWHLSQFAADYRRMFGELPSQTLRLVN